MLVPVDTRESTQGRVFDHLYVKKVRSGLGFVCIKIISVLNRYGTDPTNSQQQCIPVNLKQKMSIDKMIVVKKNCYNIFR
jgi:hypothetical protein